MAIFEYTAIDKTGKTVSGNIEQPDRSNAIAALTRQEMRPVSLNEAKQKPVSLGSKSLFGSEKVKQDHLVMFTRQLAAMIGAGVPLLRALNALEGHIADSPALKKKLNGVIESVESGSTFADALGKYPETFNDIYVNMVRAGEAAGILEDILNRLALQQEKSMSMRKKVRGAMAYPMVLLSITVLAFFGLMIFIIPEIGKIIKDLGGANAQLPAITQFMLGVSDFILKFWYLVIGGLAAGIFGFLRLIKTPAGKRNFDAILLKTPVIKKIVTKITVARFARTFSALIEAGVAVLEALDVTSRAVGNSVYGDALTQAELAVKNGKTLSSVIETYKIFPPIIPQMLMVGEETGQTDKILIKVADFFEEEVDNAIASISSIIEPIMIVVMGSMVGLIAASVMLPIASLSQTIK